MPNGTNPRAPRCCTVGSCVRSCSGSPDRHRRHRCGSRARPTPSRHRTSSCSASSPAASVGPTCSSSKATWRPAACRSCRATRSSAASSAVGDGGRGWAVGDRAGVAWLASTCGNAGLHERAARTSARTRGSPAGIATAAIATRDRRARRLRAAHAGRLRRPRRRAAAVRRRHRLPLAKVSRRPSRAGGSACSVSVRRRC